ncbi:hypothetical protein STENM223S_09796 [Streptomyces tendae]
MRTGSRTSTPIRPCSSPLSAYVATTTVSCRVRPPSAGNDSVRQPGSTTEPSSAAQR